jgi:hypothetical protein
VSNHFPIPSPPPELVGEWLCSEDYPWGPLEQASVTITTNRLQNVATQAAQWGADQELEACSQWLPKLPPWSGNDLRKHRRPKPPRLKEQALSELNLTADPDGVELSRTQVELIRKALEALDG